MEGIGRNDGERDGMGRGMKCKGRVRSRWLALCLLRRRRRRGDKERERERDKRRRDFPRLSIYSLYIRVRVFVPVRESNTQVQR